MTSKRTDIIFTLLTIPIDALMVLFAFISSYWLRSETELLQVIYLWPFDNYVQFIALMLPFWIIIFALAGLYSQQAMRPGWGNFTKVFLAVSAGIMFFVAYVFLSRTLFFSRLIVVYAWILGIVFVTLGRFLLGQIRKALLYYGVGARSVIIVGTNETAVTLKNELEYRRDLGYRVLNGLFEPKVKTIGEYIEKHKVDELIVADTSIPSNQVLEIMNLAEEHAILFRLVPNLFEVRSTNVEVQTLAAIPIIEYQRTPLAGWASLVKRVMDIVLSSLAIVVLSPVFALLSLLVKLDSSGPIFYRQRRLGLHRKHFYIYKFRTMKSEFCTGDDFSGQTDEEIFLKKFKDPKLLKNFITERKLEEDPRVTRLGRFLRKTSLDELPQLFNVFMGQIALVGPRPMLPQEIEKCGDLKHRLFIIKPGLTGLWQVSGRSSVPFSERIKLDAYYIENWSLWQDLIIMAKTVVVILLRKNAY